MSDIPTQLTTALPSTCKEENGSYNQGSYYRNAKSAAVLVNPLTVRAVEVLHVQLHF